MEPQQRKYATYPIEKLLYTDVDGGHPRLASIVVYRERKDGVDDDEPLAGRVIPVAGHFKAECRHCEDHAHIDSHEFPDEMAAVNWLIDLSEEELSHHV